MDLINSFCIRSGEEAVIDPACGGGTFLVRAYARKRELAPGRSHEQMLTELYGVDISPFACHLTTINLATRDLIQHENYPLIARAPTSSTWASSTSFLSLPSRARSKGLGRIQHRDITIPLVDAVIGNPPYVRQEEIKSDKAKGRATPDTERRRLSCPREEGGAGGPVRPQRPALLFLAACLHLPEAGRMALPTHVEPVAGRRIRLQASGLDSSRFKIIAIFESMDEPWFVGARVATTATLLQLCPNPEERARNIVRFVQLRQSIADILVHDGTTAGAMGAADDFRDEILSLTENTLTSRYRARLVPQRELFEDGVRLARLMRKSGDADEEENDEDIGSSSAAETYYGGKWGIHLRAPDLWFELMDRFGESFTPLGELAEVRFGVKSGKDEFFFPRDASRECLDRFPEFHEFRQEFGVARERVESGEIKLARCGEGYGQIRPIKSKYFEPEVHSLMEVKSYAVGPEDCGRMILLVDKPRSELKGTYLLRYIEWGEFKGWHKGATCAARVTDAREWYDLTGHRRGAMFWPKSQQYKHAAPRTNMAFRPTVIFMMSSRTTTFIRTRWPESSIPAFLFCLNSSMADLWATKET